MNLTLCSKSCPYQSDGRCHKLAESHPVSSLHDCPSCPYLSVCEPMCVRAESKSGFSARHRRKQAGFTCFFEDGMV